MEFERLSGMNPGLKEVRRRVEHVKQILIHHPNYQEVLNELQEMLVFSEGSVSPDGLFLFGPSGAGKSTVTKEFTAQYPRVEVVESNRKYTSIPILHVIVPPKSTPKMLASKILEIMKDPLHHKGSVSELTSRIHHNVEVLGIKMIILDEFQHLIDAETEYVLATVSNWVKTFTEEIKIPVVLCGMPESVKVFISNPQLDRRFCNKVELGAFEYGEANEIITFRTFLAKVDSLLPFADKSHLADPRLADKIYYISNGVPFYIMKLLEKATYFAATTGANKIEEIHMAKALTKMKQVGRPYVINPFLTDQFDLESAMKSEKDAEERYKEKLIVKRRRRRRKTEETV